MADNPLSAKKLAMGIVGGKQTDSTNNTNMAIQEKFSSNAYNKANPYVAPTTSSSSGSKGSSGGSSSSSSVSGGNALSSYLDQMYAQKMAAARDAYNNGIGRLNDAYNNARNNYGNIYNRGVENLNSSYNNSLGKIDSNAQDAMQEAYVNKMLSLKNLSQALSAQGISGGASESATAGMLNNYGNARNGIQKTWDTNRGDLEQTYNTNLGNLYSAYQSQMANLDQNRANAMNALESNLANAVADYSNSFLSAIMSNPSLLNSAVSTAQSNQAAFTPEEAAATNAVNSVNTQQSNDIGQATNGGKYAAMIGQGLVDVLNRAGNAQSQVNLLANKGYGANDIQYILNQLYG